MECCPTDAREGMKYSMSFGEKKAIQWLTLNVGSLHMS